MRPNGEALEATEVDVDKHIVGQRGAGLGVGAGSASARNVEEECKYG